MFVIFMFMGMAFAVPVSLAIFLYSIGNLVGAAFDLFMIGPIWASYFLYLYNRHRDRNKVNDWNREVNRLRYRRS